MAGIINSVKATAAAPTDGTNALAAASTPDPAPKLTPSDGNNGTDGGTIVDPNAVTTKPTAVTNTTTQPTLAPNPDPGADPAPTAPPAPAPTPGDGTPGSPTPTLPGQDHAGATPAAPAAPAASTQAWNPTTGIVDQVKQADVNTIQGASYTPTTTPDAKAATTTGYTSTGVDASLAPDAQGYTAHGYDASTVGENLSGAVSRIVGDDSPVLQRARALADQQSNARGILDSTMGVQAGTAATLDAATQLGQGDVNVSEFNANAKNTAAQFLATSQNQADQFLAAAKNQNGMFNASQSQQATEFTAQAKDTASQLLAAAQNTASMFNTGEANKQAQFAVTQTNNALMFAAQMEQAAREQNATAFNQAHQRYTDAVNAALAAQNDAENLAKRDTAQLGESRYESDSRNAASVASASIGANASLEAAKMASADRANALAEQAKEYGLSLTQQQTQFAANLSATQFNQFQSGLSAGLTSQLEPDAKQHWLSNYMSVWSASGSLPFTIDTSKFPAATP